MNIHYLQVSFIQNYLFKISGVDFITFRHNFDAKIVTRDDMTINQGLVSWTLIA